MFVRGATVSVYVAVGLFSCAEICRREMWSSSLEAGAGEDRVVCRARRLCSAARCSKSVGVEELYKHKMRSRVDYLNT